MAVASQIEVIGEQLEKLLHREPGIEHGGERDLLRDQKIAQALQHRGLARAHLAGQDDETFPALHAVNQVGQRFFVLRAAEQKDGSGTQVERIFVKPKKALYIEADARRRYLANLTIRLAAAQSTEAVTQCSGGRTGG